MAILKLYYLLPFFLISGPFLSDLLVSLTSLFFLFYFIKYDESYSKTSLQSSLFYFILFYYLFRYFQ